MAKAPMRAATKAARKPGKKRATKPARTIETLVLSAWEPELAPLRRLLAASGRAEIPNGGRGVALAAVGVGMVDAAVGAAEAIARAKPGRVIFVGTAGAYPTAARALPMGAAALAGELRLLSTATLQGDAYHPTPLVATASTTLALRRSLARAAKGAFAVRTVVVACPLAITRAAGLARRIATTGPVLENLEAFAVARAAASAGRPFAAVLGVSNIVGPHAHHEWRAHHQAASRAACHVVWRLLEKRGA
jgi:nucleoside phosphorylase